MSKHSPTPWGRHACDCMDRDNRVTAFAHGGTPVQAEANAALIVSCVNACAEGGIVQVALERARDFLDELEPTGDTDWDDAQTVAISTINEALAAVTGEE